MQIIVKTTEACNGTCIYCSAKSTETTAFHFKQERLGDFFKAFRPWFEQDRSRTLHYTWHGGEPLLLGPDFFKAVKQRQGEAFGSDLPRVANLVQSNLTLVNEEWIPILKELNAGGRIGTSLDIVDGVRGIRSGENLIRKWLEAAHHLIRNNLSFGLIYVVHKKSLPLTRDIYYFMKNIVPGVSIRFNPLYREGRAKLKSACELEITGEEYGRFLVELCDLWLKDGGRRQVLPLSEWHRAWYGDYSQLCCDSAGLCHQSHLGIAPNGDVYPCGRFVDTLELLLGNIFEDGINDIVNHEIKGRIAARWTNLRKGPCSDCSFWDLCHGGCPNISWLYYGDLDAKTFFCDARMAVFKHFEKVFGPRPIPQSQGRSVN